MKTSSVVQSLPASGIRKIFDRAVELERAGEKLIRFDVGQPDLATPSFIVEAAKRALDDGVTRYTANRGLPELLEAIAQKLRVENGAVYDPQSEIIVTAGATEAVADVILGIMEPGSSVLIPEPAWPHYAACTRLAGATPLSVPTRVEDGFTPTAELLERHVRPDTRLLVLNSPSNPSGAVLSRTALETVLDFAGRHDLWVLADEIYEHMVFDERPPSFASLPGARERTIVVNSFSKAFGMTGWRLGWIAAPRELSAHLNKPHQYLTVCANSFAQRGAVAAYTDPRAATFLEGMRATFMEKRDALLEEVSGARVRFAHPAGAFYFFPELPAGSPSDVDVARALLEEARVAAVPGSVFGGAYGRFLRISYGNCTIAEIREGLRRVRRLLYGAPE